MITENLKTQISDVLREAILVGKLKPGDRLIERSLATRFDVSLAPIREALVELRKEGWIDSRPRTSTEVRLPELNATTRLALFGIRKAIEIIAVSAHSAGSDAQFLDAFDMSLESEEQEPGNEFLCEDFRFHRALVHSLSDDHLLNIWLSVTSGVRMQPSDAVDTTIRKTSILQHKMIVRACRSGDSARAVELLEKNLASELLPNGGVIA